MAKGYGLANVELSVPATENTVYQLASVTKMFTATAIMMLVKDGKIALDDKITERLTGSSGGLGEGDRPPSAEPHVGDQELYVGQGFPKDDA